MLTNSNEQNRTWLLDALAYLELFSRQDEDYMGDRRYESKAVAYQRSVVRDGKYRVVFLGAFNVGKSTAINAFLGGAYLPMDIEECTSRLTFIRRGDDMRLLLALDTAASRHEMEALERALADIHATVETGADMRELVVRCPEQHPDSMRRSLEPLVTVLADEAFPHLASLREKTESLTLCLPSDALETDIVFIDTPGVHSISETRQKITYDIIEHCHLVIAFVDSAFVGNIHDLNFIKRIITCRGRRVFFVLNKADKLDNEEIDPRATFGPAAQLVDTFRRNGIPENSDIFFLSGYRALRALELDQKYRTLEEALGDNKLMLPTAVSARLAHSANPAQDLSAYLMGQSRFPHLKERLMDYLLNENKSNAILGLAGRFVYERAEDYLISVRNALALARNPDKFNELKANRDLLQERIQTIRSQVDGALKRYGARFQGGQQDEVYVPGYVAQLRAMMTEPQIESEVVLPLLEWLRRQDNLKQARRENFKPLSAQLEHQVDSFVSTVMSKMRTVVEVNETETADAVARQISLARELRAKLTEPEHLVKAAWEAGVSGEYLAFGTGGALVGAMTGAVVGSVAPVIGTAIGAGIGGLLGAVVGFIARLAWSEERWIKKLTPMIRSNAIAMLLGNGTEGEKPIQNLLTDYLVRRGTAFEEAVRAELDHALNAVQGECDALLARETEIRRERDTIIERLKPKEMRLESIKARAEAMLDPETTSTF